MDYESAVDNVLNIPRYKKKTNQVGIRQLLHLLGDPQKQYEIIHVAGTNGKGSICAYLNEMGQTLGYKMGLFTSPHLVDIRERFQVNGELPKRETFAKVYELVKEKETEMVEKGYEPCTFFEVIFAMACVIFAEAKIDYAIVEAGMGGRSDTTNVVEPCLSIIASIGLDHTAILGDTLEAIAYEKAGIIKTSVPVIVQQPNLSVAGIIRDYAEKMGAPCHFTGEYDVEILKNSPEGIDFLVNSRYDKEGRFFTPMCGLYQVDNGVTAIMAAKVLWQLSFEQLEKGISKTVWPARMEEVYPHFYVDGAHNHQAMNRFVQTVNSYFKEDKKILLYAVASDKDNYQMLEELSQLSFQTIIITELNNSRKTDYKAVVDGVNQLFSNSHLQVVVEPEIQRAVKEARKRQLQNASYVFCVGSLYLAGEVMQAL